MYSLDKFVHTKFVLSNVYFTNIYLLYYSNRGHVHCVDLKKPGTPHICLLITHPSVLFNTFTPLSSVNQNHNLRADDNI